MTALWHSRRSLMSNAIRRLAQSGTGVVVTLAAGAHADVVMGTGVANGPTLGQSTATQLVLSPGGIGHVLLLPYFTAQNGNATIVSVTNADISNAKAVKVRFRGAANGDTLLSITVLLAPGDVWTTTVRSGSTGLAEVLTSDTTCTVPKMAAGAAQPMLTSRLNPAWSTAEKANQTREGYVEVINMADIPQNSANTALFNTIRQSPTVVCDDSIIRAAIVDNNHTTEAAASQQGLATPTTGLIGKWTIINVPQTTTYSGSLYALRAVNTSGADARANYVLFPQTDVTYGGSTGAVTTDPLLRQSHASKTYTGVTSGTNSVPVVAAAFHDFPDLSTPYVVAPSADAAQAQATKLTVAMAAVGLQNDYATDTSISGKTDWVFSMPARRYSVALNYGAASQPQALFSMVPSTGDQYFHNDNVKRSSANASLFCTDTSNQVFRDRDSRSKTIFPKRLGGPDTPLAFCGSTSVLSFSDPGLSALGAAAVRADYTAFVNGWGLLSFADPISNLGLPIVGTSFFKATNPAASPGISGTYGLTYEHWMFR